MAAAAVAGLTPAEVASARLVYQEGDFGVMDWPVSVTRRTASFEKEPATGSGRVVRGELEFGGSRGNAIPFLWQRGARKLFLDLNRNLDLTDDASGAFTARESTPEIIQSFAGVRVPLSAQSGVRHALVDLTLRDYNSRLRASAVLRSCWQGKLTLQGVEWQAGMLWNPAAKLDLLHGCHILLRPWEERDQPFSAGIDSPAVLPFSPRLFIREHAYHLNCEAAPGDDSTQIRLQFTEQTAALGKVKIAGAFVQRLLLEGGPYLVVIDQPEGPVRVPSGHYSGHKVWLGAGNTRACLKSDPQKSATRIVVDVNQMTTLTAGGPLTNTVSVQRRGRNLQLSYQLVGAGGKPYELVGPDRTRLPEFAIYQDGRQIASGKFQFG